MSDGRRMKIHESVPCPYCVHTNINCRGHFHRCAKPVSRAKSNRLIGEKLSITRNIVLLWYLENSGIQVR